MPILLASFYFFYFAIVGVYIIFMPKVLSMVGYSASDIGMIFAAGPLVRFILPFAFTRGMKLNIKSFNTAIVIMLLSSVSFYFSIDNFYKLLFSNIGLGIGLSLILPYIEVISLKTIGKERYGKIRLFGSVGFVLVALVLVKFLSSADIALSYLLVLTFLTAMVAFVIAKNADASSEKAEEVDNDISLLSDWKLWAGLTLMQVSFGAFYNFFTIYETDYGISMDMTIYLWSFGVIAEIFMLFFQGRLLRGNLLLILQITTFVTAIRWFLLFLFPENLMILFFSQTLHALSFALFHSAAISYLYYLYKHKSLAQQFFSGITYGLGGFVGAIYAGYVYELFPRYLFLSAAFIAFMASWSLYLWSQKLKRNVVV
ncbi:MFS transporter [Sulfurimonas gotlandica GD1]|uniref:MFS transporter n=1 Tax=Sulfurimonas gotlandica (strain DSM 19862 / JCM 16533 / GD1) TaxID=929558 RepID=B6BH47_SULGG|nr:MFS transporter [Sulfurimonas gotlandica]EDZ63313.1 putative MFS metabolite transporter [Sulfurimonas gotlandica GD1]EHP29836.1 MFS transporter [Sulfurimonas gotlandica GD1]